MATRCVPRTRALTIGLLVLLLVVSGATPAAAGAPGPAGSGKGGRSEAGAHGGGQEGGASRQQAGGGSAPAARKSQAAAPRPARKSTAPERGAARSEAPARPKPSAARPAKPEGPAKPQAPAEPAKGKPHEEPAPGRETDDATQRRRESSAEPAPPEVRSEAVSAGSGALSRSGRTSQVRTAVRPLAATVTPAQLPSAALAAAPPSAPVELAVVERGPRDLWPPLPGPVGHPAFPALLAAVLLGFAALGCRGDRRDPKLAAAAIDDRDDRAPFR